MRYVDEYEWVSSDTAMAVVLLSTVDTVVPPPHRSQQQQEHFGLDLARTLAVLRETRSSANNS